MNSLQHHLAAVADMQHAAIASAAHLKSQEVVQQEAVQIWKMIVYLDRTVQLIDCDIATEEQRTGISDRSDAAYPILARMLAARRDNLKETTTALEQRLSKLDQASWSLV
jgi:predicted Ser/Thr protein kinase